MYPSPCKKESHTNTPNPQQRPLVQEESTLNQHLMGDSGWRGGVGGVVKLGTHKETHIERLGSAQGPNGERKQRRVKKSKHLENWRAG